MRMFTCCRSSCFGVEKSESFPGETPIGVVKALSRKSFCAIGTNVNVMGAFSASEEFGCYGSALQF